jgi:hypothetical protein
MKKIMSYVVCLTMLTFIPAASLAADKPASGSDAAKVEIVKTAIYTKMDQVQGSRVQKKIRLFANVTVENAGKQPARNFFVRADCQDCEKLKWKVYPHRDKVADRIGLLKPGERQSLRVVIAETNMGINESKDKLNPPTVKYSVVFDK